ncbi:hypothetical protein VTI74DRAFT_6688 [Chaetomium olivicolor]
MARNPFLFGTDIWDPTHRFETSWLLSPWWLFCCRALLSLYIFTTLLFILGWQCTHADDGCAASRATFSYFTHLTYWGLGFYFLFAATHTFTYARSGVALLDRFPRPLQALHAFFYTTITVYPIIVTVVFWARLYSGKWFPEVFSGWSNISQHLLNSFFGLFEVVIPRTDTSPPVHMAWLILVLALYLALAYVTKATKNFYPYDFLNPATQHGLVAAYAFGIAVGCIVVFGFVWGLIWLRKFVTETKLGKTGKFAKTASGGGELGEPKDLEMAKPEETIAA